MKTSTHTLLSLTVLILTCATLLAQDERVPDIFIGVASGDIQSNVSNNAGLKTIFSNLGSKTDAYYDEYGYYVSGPRSSKGTQWIAMPFTPKANAAVTQIQIAVAYFGSGTNGFNLVLAADASGQPGKTLHSWNLKNLIPNFRCCKLDTATYAPGVKVKKGQQYWVVARTDWKSADSFDGWFFTWNDSMGVLAWGTGDGWIVDQNTNLCAFAVQGK